MKREWDIEDLIEYFTLSKPERDLLHGKIEAHQLGLAVLLKGFQYEGIFFKLKRDIPGVVVEFVAQQLAIEAETFRHYDWSGRTIKHHRAVIRKYLGFREAQAADRVRLARWLIEQPTLRYEHNQGHWVNQAYEHLPELRIEPFSADKMERIVRSALNTYQNQMCQTIQARLSETTFVQRWQLEVTFEAARRHLGLETQRQWSDKAIARTTPLLLGLFSWVTLVAHDLFAAHPALALRQAAWYPKPLPTFSDALAWVRLYVWQAVPTFQTSRQNTDTVEIPKALFDTLISTLSYAA